MRNQQREKVAAKSSLGDQISITDPLLLLATPEYAWWD